MHQMLVIGNPSKRRKRRKSAKRATSGRRRYARKSAKRSKSRSYIRARRNPISVGGIAGTVKAGAIGAVGGVANDVLYGFAASKLSFLPQSGIAKHAAKLATALVVGKLGNMALRGKGRALAEGAATVAIHAGLKEQLASMPFLASLPLGEYITDGAPQLAATGVNGYDAAMPVDGYMDETSEMGEYLEA